MLNSSTNCPYYSPKLSLMHKVYKLNTKLNDGILTTTSSDRATLKSIESKHQILAASKIISDGYDKNEEIKGIETLYFMSQDYTMYFFKPQVTGSVDYVRTICLSQFLSSLVFIDGSHRTVIPSFKLKRHC